MRPTLTLALALWACSKPDPQGDPTTGEPTTATGVATGTGTGTTGGTPTDPYCADPISATWPEDGRQNVYYRTAIEFFMNPILGDEVLEVREAGGAVPGTMAYWSDRIEFVPDGPLAPQTAYTVAIEGCPQSEVSWQTSTAGTPIDPSNAVGTTYAVNLETGRWIEPPGAGALLTGNLTVDILVSVVGATPTTLTVLGGVTEEFGSNQDLCSETVMFPDAAFDQNPYFELGPQDISIGILGAVLDMTSLHLSGAFRPDFSGIEGASLEGQLDTRGLVDLLAPGQGDDGVCVLLATLGVACIPCTAGGGDYCVDARVEDLAVPSHPGPLVPRTAYDIAMDPSCP